MDISNIHPKEDKEMSKFFHINIYFKKTKLDALFDSNSQAILIVEDLFSKIELEFHAHPHPYPLGWLNKDGELKVNK